MLVYNHAGNNPGRSNGYRSPLNLAISSNGKDWAATLVLEDEPRVEFSYPAIIQTSDGLVHITYTWKRQRIKHAVIDPAKLVLQPISGGQWPAAESK